METLIVFIIISAAIYFLIKLFSKSFVKAESTSCCSGTCGCSGKHENRSHTCQCNK